MERRRFRKKITRNFINLCLIVLVCYGVGRLYFRVTGGFTIANITSEFSPDPRWETHLLSPDEQEFVDSILSQDFYYLGKGCQSYVFLSVDEEYVIKFFKYQRFRPQAWLDYLSFISPVEKVRQAKIEKKRRKLEGVFTSWKIGFDHLQEETGLVYVHLNKNDSCGKLLTIYDKMGIKHALDVDKMEFLIQRRADMLCPTIDNLMLDGKTEEAKILLTKLVKMVSSEYERGLADNDHALMQNTGVYHGKPIHVDVGQFVQNEKVKDPEVAHQEIFNKTYKFRIWLQQHPELITHLDNELHHVLGDKFYSMKHIPNPRGIAE